MCFRNACIILLLLLCVHRLSAQQMLKGTIYDQKTDSVLGGVTLYNVTRNEHTISNNEGVYSIHAQESDKIIFSSIGYKTDTVKVSYYMFQAGYDVSLVLKTSFLKSVTVFGTYHNDSIRRREEYADILDKPKNKFTMGNAATGTVGISVKPFGGLSSQDKQRESLKKVMALQEEQAFVDYSFSRSYVEKLTNLHGDSLKMFMFLYRPSYEFCRATNKTDMLVYINDKLKLYMKKEDVPTYSTPAKHQ